MSWSRILSSWDCTESLVVVSEAGLSWDDFDILWGVSLKKDFPDFFLSTFARSSSNNGTSITLIVGESSSSL